MNLPTNDPDKMDMIRVIMHESTHPSNLGEREYQNGDRVDHPTGQGITNGILEQEAANIAGVIRNFANNHRVSIRDAINAIAHAPGYPTEKVLSTGQERIDEAMGDTDSNRKGRCAQLKRAIKAVNGEVAPDMPTTFEHWHGVLQELPGGRTIVRHLNKGEVRHANTDFF